MFETTELASGRGGTPTGLIGKPFFAPVSSANGHSLEALFAVAKNGLCGGLDGKGFFRYRSSLLIRVCGQRSSEQNLSPSVWLIHSPGSSVTAHSIASLFKYFIEPVTTLERKVITQEQAMEPLPHDAKITTPMLDFDHPEIRRLVAERGWQQLSSFDAIGAIHTYVRDDILFGYNADDCLPASQVLKDGYGQCNTKGTLLMSLLRAVGIANRMHGFTIYNELQRGAIPRYLFPFAPERILHCWGEGFLDGRWINLEGYIIDRPYLSQVQAKFSDQCEQFSGFGIATQCLSAPAIDWQGQDTYIQSDGIADDFGCYTQPDDFYKKYGSNLSGLKKIAYRYLLRHLMNANVKRIRYRGLG
jgi:hypothetical protein